MSAADGRPAYAVLVPDGVLEHGACAPGPPSPPSTRSTSSTPPDAGPTVAGRVLTGLDHVGELIRVPTAPDPVPAVRAAVRLAASLGAPVVGLGALEAEARCAGAWLAAGLPAGPALTAGHAYTAAVARHNVLEALGRTGLGSAGTTAVVGAPRSLGALTARLLALEGVPVTLVAPRLREARAAVAHMPVAVEAVEAAAALREADVVLVLTADAARHVGPAGVRRDSLVIDVAGALRPGRLADRRASAWDTRCVPGGLVHVPGYRASVPLAGIPRTATRPWLAAAYLTSLQRRPDCEPAVPTVADALRQERLAAADGVTPRALDLPAVLTLPAGSAARAAGPLPSSDHCPGGAG